MSDYDPKTTGETPLDANGDEPTSRKPPERSGPRLTGVRYGAMAWIGEFKIPAKLDFPCGAKVVVQTERGIELGEHLQLTCARSKARVEQQQIDHYVQNSGPEFYRPRSGRILREATAADVSDHDHLNAHNRDDIRRCQQQANELELEMKVVTVEHLLGGERIVFYFRSEGRVDFRELVRRLARHYQTRIEMRQVGARDEARLVADYEVCGRECCCKNFLKKLRPVTMKMAKLQKSTLDPSKVSGRCGRLRCCLRYENEGYEELAAQLPKVNARVETVLGPGRVVDRQILTQLLLIRLEDDGRTIAFPLEEIGPPGTKLTPATPEPQPQPEPDAPARDERAPDDGADPGKPRRRGRRPRRRQDEQSADPPRDDRPEPGNEATPPAGADERASRSRSGGKRRRRGGRRRPRRRNDGNAPGGDSADGTS